MKMVLMFFMSIVAFKADAQNNQIKLYIQQIAANKVYIEYLQKGYAIVKSGLNTIGNIKNGHFHLDIDFFDGLEKVNPKIRHYKKVADIISLNIQVVKRADKLISEVQGNDLFTNEEITFFKTVVDALLNNCAALVDELASLLKTSAFKMSDDERIKRIEGVYVQMRDNYGFVNYFSGELEILRLQKIKELQDVKVLNNLNND